ncbi:MAG: PilZ domain-containing protein [Deltaproteobacteria bacterium]|nr:PilZ domain-containing protein [Deltaproteobacteria bacterium]
MEIRICPKCGKVFYALINAECLICHHCNHLLYDQRAAERIPVSVDFIFHRKSAQVSATLEDYSATGVRIAYSGKALEIDAVIGLDIVDIEQLAIDMTAKTVWTKRLAIDTKTKNAAFESGLRLIKEC